MGLRSTSVCGRLGTKGLFDERVSRSRNPDSWLAALVSVGRRVRTFLLGAILIATMMNGCVQRAQQSRIEGHLRTINAMLQTGLKIRVEIPQPKPASIDEKAERDT